MRIAAIDIGTNSIHMVIARAIEGRGFEVEDKEREVVQVGRGSFDRTRLRADAIRRTVQALARFTDLARRRQVDRILCTATAAVREARNGGALVQAAREATGIAPRVIPPEEEGRLIYLGVKSAIQLDAAPALIVDIGGGSVQLVTGNRDQLIEVSAMPLGALRLTERFVESDPPRRRELQRLRREIRRQAKPVLEAVAARGANRAYGSSGSIHALAQLVHREKTGATLGRINGFVLSRGDLSRLARRLEAMNLAEREKLVGIDPHRAEIIVAGALVLDHILRQLDLDQITMSDFGVREGLVLDYLVAHAPEVRALGQVEELRLRSVLQLLQKFQPEERHLKHARHVAQLSLTLFDGLRALHGLSDDARETLHYAALLHDVGAMIGYDGHGQHSEYIIRHGNLRDLTPEHVDRIATVARYHGKARPRKRDQVVRDLGRRRRRELRWLSAMLRIAEALDRSHYQLVRSVKVRRRGRRITIELTAGPGARLEMWAVRRRTELLEKMIGGPVRVTTPARAALRDSARARAGKAPRPAASGARPARSPASSRRAIARPAVLPLPARIRLVQS